MKVVLQPLESQQIAVRGRTVVYLAGETTLSFETVHGRFEIPAGGQVDVGGVFDSITITNKGNVPCNADVMIIDGLYERLSDVSIVQIQGITNTISAQIVNDINATITGTVQAEVTNALTVSGTVAADLVPAGNVITTEYTLNAVGFVEIPARAGRKRLEIQGYSESENTILCQVSDATKTEISGQLLPIGGGLLTSVEQKHAAAVKVWSPVTDVIELKVLEEY